MKTAKPWEEDEGMEKLRKYCAYQERCRSEAWTKLYQLGCPSERMDHLLAQLEYESFLDEGRYANSFVRGKFNQKGWGRVKIRAALQGKRLPSNLVAQALNLIDPVAYAQMAVQIARKKLGNGDLQDWDTQQKLAAFMEGKGYEWDAISDAIQDLKDEGNQ
jgi:regulatory protein